MRCSMMVLCGKSHNTISLTSRPGCYLLFPEVSAMQAEIPPGPKFDIDFPSLAYGFSLAPVEMVLLVVFPFGFKFLGFEGFPCPPECSGYDSLNDHACIVLSHSIPHVTPFFMHVLQYFSPPFARKMAPHPAQTFPLFIFFASLISPPRISSRSLLSCCLTAFIFLPASLAFFALHSSLQIRSQCFC